MKGNILSDLTCSRSRNRRGRFGVVLAITKLNLGLTSTERYTYNKRRSYCLSLRESTNQLAVGNHT